MFRSSLLFSLFFSLLISPLFTTLAASANAGGRGRICEVVVPPRQPPPPSQSCVFNPTTRVEVVLNLDAGLENPRIFSFFGPADLQRPLTVRDSLGQPRIITLRWRRNYTPGEWLFEVGIEPEDATRPPRIASELSVIQSGGTLRFDSKGALIGVTEIPVLLEFSGDVEPQQEIVFSFESDYGATRQFALQSEVYWFDEDGGACQTVPPRPMPACWLAESLAREQAETRGGALTISSQGVFLSSQDERVQGRPFDRFTGKLTDPVTDARISDQFLPGAETRRIEVAFQFDTNVPIESAVDPVRYDPGGSIYWQVVPVFDSFGGRQFLFLTFWRTAVDRWEWAALNPYDLNGSFSNSPNPVLYEVVEAGRGTLLFDEPGRLAVVTQNGRELPSASLPRILPRLRSHGGGEQTQAIELDFGVGTTYLADVNRALRIESDGHGAGILSSLRVSRDLVVMGGFSSGIDFPIAKLALATAGELLCQFDCSNGLDDDGDGLADAPDDPGCDSGLDIWERSGAIACDDGRDNDLDGLRDYPQDPECDSPADTDESPTNIEIKVVDRLVASRFEDGLEGGLEGGVGSSRADSRRRGDQILVLAVLNPGGVPLGRLDPLSLRLEPSGLRPFEPDARLTDRYPEIPDVDCDGSGDKLLFFRVEEPRHGRRRSRKICLSGTFEARFPGGTPLPGSGPARLSDFFEATEFRACTTEPIERGRTKSWRTERSDDLRPSGWGGLDALLKRLRKH